MLRRIGIVITVRLCEPDYFALPLKFDLFITSVWRLMLFSFRSTKRLIISTLLLTAPIIAISAPAFAYPRATITNYLPYSVTGTIHYAACRKDTFTVAPAKVDPATKKVTPTHTTMSSYRGGCLITEIMASGKPADVMPMLGRHTPKSQFVVNYVNGGGLRNANGFDAAVYPAP